MNASQSSELPPGLFDGAPPSVRADFLKESQPFTLPAGRQMLLPGEELSGVGFVSQGVVRVYLVGADGREVTLYHIRSGESCVLATSCVLGATSFPACAVVEQECSGHMVPLGVFRQWVQREPFWREHAFRLLSQRMAGVLSRFEHALFTRLDERLAGLLLQMRTPDTETVERTQQAIANELGSAPEVVSRVFKRWSQRGIVRVQRGSVLLLDRDHLARLARHVGTTGQPPSSAPATAAT